MPDLKRYVVDKPYLQLGCGLGEAPFWEEEHNSLRFVDIVKKKVHFIDLEQGPSSHRQLDLDFSVGTTANIEGKTDEFVFGGKLGYGVLDRNSGASRWIKKMWTDEERKSDGGGKPGKGDTREERMRSNDGSVDARGRYFVGAMNDPVVVDGNVTDEGVLFRLDPDLTLHRIKEGVRIPNGISWTLDNKQVYITDSPSECIMRYPYDIETGDIMWNEGQTFFKTPYEGTVPDGHAQDEEGFLWVSIFGSGKVVRVDLSGEIVAEITLPTRCVTCPGFCGTKLFITSAEEEEPDKHPDSKEYQGDLFVVDVGVRGAPLNRFKMT